VLLHVLKPAKLDQVAQLKFTVKQELMQFLEIKDISVLLTELDSTNAFEMPFAPAMLHLDLLSKVALMVPHVHARILKRNAQPCSPFLPVVVWPLTLILLLIVLD